MAGYIGARSQVVSSTSIAKAQDFTATDTTPEVTIVNNTHEDTDGGREGKVIFKGQQSGGEESTLAEIQGSHDGSSDDEKGDLIFKTNDGSDGASPTTAMTIDSAQNVGIGTSSPSTRVHIVPPDNTTANKITYGHGVARADINDVVAGGFDSEFVTRDGNINTGAFIRVIDTNTNSSFPTTIRGGVLSFGTVDGTTSSSADADEKMRIDSSGNVLIGGTNTNPIGNHVPQVMLNGVGGSHFHRDGGVAVKVGRDGDGATMQFFRQAVAVGDIALSSSSTAYNTSSDYRLKENVTNITDGITRVKQLSPKRFNFIVDADKTVDGFLAHEAQTVVPEAVTGTKDEVDDDDNAVMQGIDQSKLVPLLTAALQEAIAKIETLETKVAALETE